MISKKTAYSHSTLNTFYSKQNNYELWAHQESNELIIQCKTYLPEGNTKIFQKTFHSSSLEADPNSVFDVLINGAPLTVDCKKGIIFVDHKSLKNHGNITVERLLLKLEEKDNANEASLDNEMLIYMIKESAIEKNNPIESNQNSENIEPINFENEEHKFHANINEEKREIQTELTVKTTNENQSKEKTYKSNIKENDWTEEYIERFFNIETLFEHLRNPNNYEVVNHKGIIRIKNEPTCSLKRRVSKNEQKLCTKNMKGENFTKELEEMKAKLENELKIKIKESEHLFSGKEKANLKKLDDKFEGLYLELKNYLNDKIKDIVKKVKKEMNLSVLEISKNAIEAVNARKDHSVLEAQKRARGYSMDVSKDFEFNNMLKELQKQTILDKNSLYLSKFKIMDNNLVEYEGSWDWTQIFASIEIKHERIFKMKFKIAHSSYNALAIGVSSISNRTERSSLTKKESISYWGDGEVWEGKKLREEGNGFKTGQIIQLEVRRDLSEVKWYVNDVESACQKSEFVGDKTVKLFPYFEMYDKGDKLQLLEYTLS